MWEGLGFPPATHWLLLEQCWPEQLLHVGLGHWRPQLTRNQTPEALISPKPGISARNWGFGPEEVESPCAPAFELLGCSTLPGGVALLGNLWEPCNHDQKLDHNPEVAAAAAVWAGALKASTAWAAASWT